MNAHVKTIPGLVLPVRNVFCIGRNYPEHARELGNPVPSEPVVFLKPVSAICYSGDTVILPRQSTRVDHELEVVVAMGESGRIAGYGVGIDLTARDLQERAKQKALPWATAKGFDTFAPISSFVPPDQVNPGDLEFSLRVNGVLKQSGNTRDMLFTVAELVRYLSSIFTLAPGDLIFTGTPQGVGPLQPGDALEARLGADLARLGLQVRKA